MPSTGAEYCPWYSSFFGLAGISFAMILSGKITWLNVNDLYSI